MTQPNFYLIGDVQGCSNALRDLLNQIPHDADIWFCGDLVNRGPDSLSVLQQIKALGKRARVVLGNHDIHLLAVAAGARKKGKSDTLDEILYLPNRDEWLDWLRHQPLAHFEHGVLMVHAGVWPSWTLADVLARAGELEALLRSDDYTQSLQTLFGNEPNAWHDDLVGVARLRVITNVFTRMRTLQGDVLDYGFKAELKDLPHHLTPWFAMPRRQTIKTPIFFGHWSALGFHQENNTTCLDTGCVWGRELTAYHYPSGELLTAFE
ncbi:bis(5'-nucleosyl)-tetraphosphatase, symmetrical [Formosimonas limnophila]|uniref:bis(5'-nucleosyl)-tetraphosphatase (symmetrical) n=1 Tax=Formosimonas limnophila TaxID=1384487 RepID=A0A8J3G0H2_9BURK|nr:symmetrical bis(5'-nucleosyl)-tetraphosphatase [Formosimonas limnophila]GHA73801.1 bis(5'-nucleosyl)-tetraphosphatase, symmetrical [Formosimonas limnophila]